MLSGGSAWAQNTPIPQPPIIGANAVVGTVPAPAGVAERPLGTALRAEALGLEARQAREEALPLAYWRTVHADAAQGTPETELDLAAGGCR